METIDIRPFHISDRENILILFRDVFGSSRTPEWWDWQFIKNPFSRPIIWLAETPEKTLVGHYSLIPVPLWNKGALRKAGFSIHSMIHPNYQRRGLLQRLAASAEQQLAQDGIELGATFLNDNSLPVYTDRLGWHEITGGLPIYVRVLDASPLIERYWKASGWTRMLHRYTTLVANALLAPPLPANCGPNTIVKLDNFDERVDTLWQSIRRHITFGTDRNSNYLNWRISDNPNKYQIYGYLSGEDLKGLIVTRCDRKFGSNLGYIVELMFEPQEPAIGKSLLEFGLRKFLDSGVHLVTALGCKPLGTHTLFTQCGFRQPPKWLMPHDVHFCLRDNTASNARSPDVQLLSLDRWYLSWSDHDVV